MSNYLPQFTAADRLWALVFGSFEACEYRLTNRIRPPDELWAKHDAIVKEAFELYKQSEDPDFQYIPKELPR